MIQFADVDVTDEELVTLSIQNKEYFAFLISRYESRLFWYVRRIYGITREEVEDVVQEVFIKTYLNLNDFDTTLKFSSWVYRIAHHQTVSAYRKRQVRPEGNRIDVEDSVLHQIASDEDIVRDLDRKVLSQNVRTALAELDEVSREILVLKYFEEKDYSEIADILEEPLGTVATHIHRAKKKLRLLMEKKTRIFPGETYKLKI
jgi:RNA polymerase sigma-70 factor (ECF subfamily)